jgi:hypothetical protein
LASIRISPEVGATGIPGIPSASGLGSLRSLYNLGLVVRRAEVFLRSPCRLAEGEDHAAAGSTDHSQELGGLG